MATRTPRTSGTAPTRSSRAMGWPEDFKPVSEWKEEEGADILAVYLPGFMSEQIKISVEGENTLRVTGERLVGANKWSRFQEDYPIPENCNTRDIRANFGGGTLAITMQRKSIPLVSPKVEAPSPPEATSKQMPRKGPEEDIQAKPDNTKQRDAKNVQPSSPPKPEPMPQKGSPIKPQKGSQEDIRAVPKADNANQRDTNIVRRTSPPKAPTTQEATSKQRPQKGTQEDIRPKADLEADKAKQRDTNIVQPSSPPKPEPMPQKGSPIKPHKGPQEDHIIRPRDEKAKQRDTNIVRPSNPQNFATEPMPPTVQEDNTFRDNKRKDGTNILDGCGNKLDGYIQTVKGLARGLSEDRQLTVNMGIVALVFLAAGVSMSYSFGSSGKAED